MGVLCLCIRNIENLKSRTQSSMFTYVINSDYNFV